MPSFEIGTARAFALSTLVNRTQLVVVHFKKRNHSLTLTIGTRDVATSSADSCPASAKSACPFGKKCIFCNPAVHNRLDGVIHLVQITGG